jgi:hypothetical protein
MRHLAARLARASLFAFRSWTARVRTPLFWRGFYGALESRPAVEAAATIVRIVGRVVDGDAATGLTVRFSHLFLTGWPHHLGTAWVNLDVERFSWRLERRLRGTMPPRPRPLRWTSSPLRVGILANLSSTLTFIRPFFESAPENVELFAFDLAGRERASPYLSQLVTGYNVFAPGETAQIGSSIERSDLDLLLFDLYRGDRMGIFDTITTPCVVDVCTTAHLCFHENVSYHLYCLEQADYTIEAGRLYRGTSRSWFGDHAIYPSFVLFESRGLDPRDRVSWRDRNPALVFHGKLYKAVSDPYLDCIFALLADDPSLEFFLYGRDADGALDYITGAARRRGVESRVHYAGAFQLVRNEAGEVDDPTWQRVAEHLRRARLAPDPWPLGGAYSRVEAYAAGAAVPHMGVRNDPTTWGRQQAALITNPALETARGTVYSAEAYREVCRRALYDETFAEELADEQAALALNVTDPTVFWDELLSRYRTWAAACGAPSAREESAGGRDRV